MRNFGHFSLAVIAAVAICVNKGIAAEAMTADEFQKELVGLPLCGTPSHGPLAGKALCTVHFADGTAVVAGSGIMVRGLWEVAGGRICRRNAHEPPEQRRCVDYRRIGPVRYGNSDGVEFCIGPCGE